MDTFEKAELKASIHHIMRFLKSGNQFLLSKFWIRLAEKREDGEEHRQLQSVLRFNEMHEIDV